MEPARTDIQVLEHGIAWVVGEELSGRCDEVPAGEWTRIQSKSVAVWAHADGPSGSGRFWRITIGLTDTQVAVPTRGFCLSTSTVGWRTLQRYARTPLPWVEDIDEDGKPELLIWDSFPLSHEPSMAEFGLVVWVYELRAQDVFTIDWELTRRMTDELAKAYGQPTGEHSHWASELRKNASEALHALASKECRLRAKVAR
jgi:hypothetical protein